MTICLWPPKSSAVAQKKVDDRRYIRPESPPSGARAPVQPDWCVSRIEYISTSPTIYLFLSFWFLISLEGATHASVAKPNNSKWFHQRFHWRKFIRLAVTQSPRRGVNSDGQLIFRLVSYTAGFYSTLMICNKFISLSRIETLGTNISINPSE